MELTSVSSHPPAAMDGSPETLIKQRASSLGFSACGITSALPPPHHREYRQWLTSGAAGEMLYLHRQEPRRANLNEVLPGVNSVVVVALNYHTGDDSCDASQGVIARYARFDDYHQTMWGRLSELYSYVQEILPSTEGKLYCDTGPITERDLAMRAGLGWIGKHTNLINRRLGNWFFIGELLLTCGLTPDMPESTHCGTCERCIPACPTGAITGPYQLDARRCISYLTIELKGSMPVELRSLIGNRVYGCDDCLAICPWNKFAVKSDDPAIRPRSDLKAPDLIRLLAMDDRLFMDTFKNSPILRTKRRGFLRNVCVALGNIGHEQALTPLTKATRDYEPLIQEHAAWAIDQITARRKGDHPNVS
jgi:epoxyqueuosine reductase